MSDRLRHKRLAESRAQALIRVEGLIRDAASLSHLQFVLASDLRPILAFETGYVFGQRRTGKLRLIARSDLGAVPSDTPFAQAFGKLLERLTAAHAPIANTAGRFRPVAFIETASDANTLTSLRNSYGLWIPLHDRHAARVGAIVLLRSEPWHDADVVVAKRIAETASHAWWAASGVRIAWPREVPRRSVWIAAAVALMIALYPAPVRVLAPYEIVAEAPALVTSPIAGVIEEIAVKPNSPVREGDLLFRFDETEFRAASRVAERHLLVAAVKRRRLEQSAIGEGEAKRALAAARAEEQLARAERDLAKSRLARVAVRARRSGTVLFTNVQDWLGRPLKVGERVMQIADAARVEARVDLPVADSIVLDRGLDVMLFPNAQPLATLSGTVLRAGHLAEPTPDGALAYALTVKLTNMDAEQVPPIGARGVAQVLGPRMPLILAALRRPIRAVRQFIGQ
ncbi:MAG: HlyD family efflux transporter periplasmic adaptor subunit [Pseudomonadota bacterium]